MDSEARQEHRGVLGRTEQIAIPEGIATCGLVGDFFWSNGFVGLKVHAHHVFCIQDYILRFLSLFFFLV